MKPSRQRGQSKTWLALMSAILLLGASVALVPACATGPGEKATGAAADVLLPPRDEEKLGDEMRQEVLKEVDVLDDPQVQAYVSELGNTAVRAARNQPEGINYNFTVIDGDELNAFAMPGGEIYVYTGLMRAMDDEAELMSVISHEVAHVSRRHIAQRLVAMYGLQALASAALGNNPGVITELAANVAAQGYLLRYSRAHETDADDHGLRYMVRAGYDPNAFIEFFEKIDKAGGARPPEFLSSHPSPQNRIADARAFINGLDSVPSTRNQQRYNEIKQRLGDSSSGSSRTRTRTDGSSLDRSSGDSKRTKDDDGDTRTRTRSKSDDSDGSDTRKRRKRVD